ncbi:MAG: phosphate ABC transporter ATP-binding protein [Caldilineaceae bacterium]|nr:phosphate ABC transporter ATP-binding protein [Caldilineaceae bacterium]
MPVSVTIRNLNVQRGDLHVLRDVTMAAKAGHIVGLLGPSGSGKSTVLRCINRLLEPPPDSVFVDDQDITAMDVLALRRQVGMVFQQPVVFPGTVADNLRFGPALDGRQLRDDEVAQLLAQADLPADLANRPATELSGGQAQRVALARTLANRPGVLLMDEPTSALDPASRKHIETMIRTATAGGELTVLWVTHDVDQARDLADYLYLLVDGRVMDQGTPEHVLDDSSEHIHLLQRFAAGELEGE